jgi:hypothetical protein
MSRTTEAARARAILAGDFFGPQELERTFGAPAGLAATLASTVPFSEQRLAEATERGEALVLRAAHAGDGALTLLRLIERFPTAFDSRFAKGMGYQLKSEWGIELEPLAGTETCAPGWSLVRKQVLSATCNLSYEEQDAELAAWGASQPGGERARRRSAVEIAFDLIAFQSARDARLLADSWDWSASRTIDGGYLNVGHFDARGMQIFSFSPGVRHGRLGVCPNVDSAS